MAKELENFIVYNAPAGSGKTTKIKKMVRNHQIEFPKDNIMCITYTNRAANELLSKINNEKVYCSTIHGCLNHLFKPFFKHFEIISLYLDLFSNEINRRIFNENNDPKRVESNNKYIEKHGELSYDVVKKI